MTVSVIVPVYLTPEATLQRCVDSLLAQTFPDLEIILVDDGNPALYQPLWEKLAQSDPRLRVLHQENAGVSAARNLGIAHASGDYLSFVDSDDSVDRGFYAKMLDAIQGADVAVCGVGDTFYPTGCERCGRRHFFSTPSLYLSLPYLNFVWNKLFRTELVREHAIRFPQEMKLGEDALFVAAYYDHCGVFQSISDPLYRYSRSGDSALHSYQERFWDWERQVILRQWSMFHQYPLTDAEEQAALAWLFQKLRGAAYYYLEKEESRGKRRQYLKEILSFELFPELEKCDLRPRSHPLTAREKLSIRIWQSFGANGILTLHRFKKQTR